MRANPYCIRDKKIMRNELYGFVCVCCGNYAPHNDVQPMIKITKEMKSAQPSTFGQLKAWILRNQTKIADKREKNMDWKRISKGTEFSYKAVGNTWNMLARQGKLTVTHGIRSKCSTTAVQ